MNASIYRISLDIQDAYAKVALDAKRGDVGRQIRVTLTDGGVPYVISPECYVLFAATKPDGNKVLNICSVEDNTVIYKITEQTVAVIGTLQCEIQVFGSDNGHLTSACFDMNVHESAADADTTSEDEMDVLAQLISDATDAIAENKAVTAEAETIVDELKESQEIRAMIGNLGNLDTAAKSSLVAAVNELVGKSGSADPEEIKKIVEDYLAANPPKETDPTVPDWAKQPEKPGYTAEEVGALSRNDLQTGIDLALAQAKESGLFDGPQGPQGIPGNDYVLTEADKTSIANTVLGLLPTWEGGSY